VEKPDLDIAYHLTVPFHVIVFIEINYYNLPVSHSYLSQEKVGLGRNHG
jgi:hypothetical protein